MRSLKGQTGVKHTSLPSLELRVFPLSVETPLGEGLLFSAVCVGYPLLHLGRKMSLRLLLLGGGSFLLYCSVGVYMSYILVFGISSDYLEGLFFNCLWFFFLSGRSSRYGSLFF